MDSLISLSQFLYSSKFTCLCAKFLFTRTFHIFSPENITNVLFTPGICAFLELLGKHTHI